MRKVILFGAAGGGARLFDRIYKKYEIVAFVDNDKKKWGEMLKGIRIESPQKAIKELVFDYVIITSAPGLDSIKKQCIDMGIPEEKIITSYIEMPLESRRVFLKKLALVMKDFVSEGACAEVGVFEGDFAKYINLYFPDRKLHLFDTFQGFDKRDIEKEKGFSNAREGDYGNTSENLVMNKMPFPDQCIIHKGYFPETAIAVDEKFCFVNLDLDLYEPTYNGLKFFSEKMTKDGVILVHDYFADNFKGPKEAVDNFVAESSKKIYKMPIGDGISIMLIGF